MDFDRSGLVALIKREFKLNWHGVHGANHWARVLYHGKTIGTIRKADLLVIELFGFLHDSCRFNEDRDLLHGTRAAEFAHGIHGTFFQLTPKQLDTLCYAMKHHSGGEVSTNKTIQTCWDADRLDLGRVRIIPSPQYLSKQAAFLIDAAYDWSIQVPKKQMSEDIDK